MPSVQKKVLLLGIARSAFNGHVGGLPTTDAALADKGAWQKRSGREAVLTSRW